MPKCVVSLFFLSFTIGDIAGEKPLLLFILAGQSNMVGQGVSKDIPAKIKKQ